MRAAYMYNEQDNQGPWVLMCEECIRADRHEVEEWIEGDDWRCACCGATADSEAA